MTKKLSFTSKWRELVNVVFEYNGIPDIMVMEYLKINPPSWKIWRTSFIEKAKISFPEIFSSKENKEIVIKINYEKKEKEWKWKEFDF
jgi:hypothetical protein